MTVFEIYEMSLRRTNLLGALQNNSPSTGADTTRRLFSFHQSDFWRFGNFYCPAILELSDTGIPAATVRFS